MAQNVSGPKYGHCNLRFVRIMSIICGAIVIIDIVLFFVTMHQKANPSFALITPAAMLPALLIGLKPHWQLSPEGILDLRKSAKDQLIARYEDIQSMRLLKNKGKQGKIFEVVTSARTYKVDVLQANDFLAELATHIDPGRIAA